MIKGGEMTYQTEADFSDLGREILDWIDENGGAERKTHSMKKQKYFLKEIDETATTNKLYDLDIKGIDEQANVLRELVRGYV